MRVKNRLDQYWKDMGRLQLTGYRAQHLQGTNTSTNCNLHGILSSCVCIECERDVSGVAPVNGGNARAVWMDVELRDELGDELCHIPPAFSVYRASAMKHERHVDHSATVCIRVTGDEYSCALGWELPREWDTTGMGFP